MKLKPYIPYEWERILWSPLLKFYSHSSLKEANKDMLSNIATFAAGYWWYTHNTRCWTVDMFSVGGPCRAYVRSSGDCSRGWGSTPRLTDWLAVSRNVTLTLTLTSRGFVVQGSSVVVFFMWSLPNVYKKQWRLFKRIRQEDVVQGNSIVEVLTTLCDIDAVTDRPSAACRRS
jgi:hypothetical protein